jgi:hypothetical protein
MNAATAEAGAFAIEASDVTGQKTMRVSSVPRGATIGELVRGLLARMGLVQSDARGQALAYRARLEREGRHLNESELVDDALRPDDRITLHPHINAG